MTKHLPLANDELDEVHDLVVTQIAVVKEKIKFERAKEKYHKKDLARLERIYENIMKLYEKQTS